VYRAQCKACPTLVLRVAQAPPKLACVLHCSTLPLARSRAEHTAVQLCNLHVSVASWTLPPCQRPSAWNAVCARQTCPASACSAAGGPCVRRCCLQLPPLPDAPAALPGRPPCPPAAAAVLQPPAAAAVPRTLAPAQTAGIFAVLSDSCRRTLPSTVGGLSASGPSSSAWSLPSDAAAMQPPAASAVRHAPTPVQPGPSQLPPYIPTTFSPTISAQHLHVAPVLTQDVSLFYNCSMN
jgi:hypothetical protein